LVHPVTDTQYQLTVYGQGTYSSTTIEVLVIKLRILDFNVVEPAVPQGGPATLYWEIANANKALLDNEPVNPVSGIKLVTPSAPTVYYLSAFGPSGGDTDLATVNVEPVVIDSFTAEPTSIEPGEPVTLRWKALWSIGTMIAPDVGPIASEGTRQVSPANDTTYVLTAQGYTGPIELARTVTVASVGIAEFFVEPTSIAPGEQATLHWKTSRATGVRLAPGIGDVGSEGKVTVSPNEPTTYSLTAFGPNGPATAQLTLDVRSVRFTEAVVSGYSCVQWKTLYCDHVIVQMGKNISRPLPPNGKHCVDDTRARVWQLTAYGAGKSPVVTKVWASDFSPFKT
jgi:hypothetical protein